MTVDAEGAWVTPGYVLVCQRFESSLPDLRYRLIDLHSHLGVFSAPTLSGARDFNSHRGTVLPWLRSLDGLNTHDDAYRLALAGGVTSALVIPGSANAIGTSDTSTLFFTSHLIKL